jgi:cyclic pyranopterin phosphate synthase
MIDTYGRRVDYLRIAVTDRCNLRCVYCMPPSGVPWISQDDRLTVGEIERFVRVAATAGVTKVRLTGGEPLTQRDVVDLARRLGSVPGIESLAVTTNGSLLARYARRLADAGVRRVNVSLCSLDPAAYSRATRGGRLEDALAGIDAALQAGLEPVKINVVVMRSLAQDPLAFARLTLDRPLHVRFIEYMPMADDLPFELPRATGSGRTEGVSGDATLAAIDAGARAAGLGSPVALAPQGWPTGWGPARYYQIPGAQGTIGFISPLSHLFCADCSRLRLTADGQLRSCLLSDDEFDVRGALRAGTDEELLSLIAAAVAAKPESHLARMGTHRRMSQVGG